MVMKFCRSGLHDTDLLGSDDGAYETEEDHLDDMHDYDCKDDKNPLLLQVIVVANYSPPGNMMGQHASNVPPAVTP